MKNFLQVNRALVAKKHFTSFQSYLSKLTIITLLLTLACGQAWGTDFTFSGAYDGTGNGSWNTTTSTTPIVTVTKNFSNASQSISCVNASKISYPSLNTKGAYIKFSVPSGYRITNVNVTWRANSDGQQIVTVFGESISGPTSDVVTATNGGYVISSALAKSGNTSCDGGHNLAISSSHNAKEVMIMRGMAYNSTTYSSANTKYASFPCKMATSGGGDYPNFAGMSTTAYIGKVVLTVEAATPTWYTLSYDANDGSGSIPAQDFISGTTVYAAHNSAITRSGYIFKGWNTEDDGTGTSYAPGASFTLSANTTLYAQWGTASTSGTYCISLYNLSTSDEMKYFTWSGSSDDQVLELALPSYNTGGNNYWVGKNGSWYNDGLGNSNAKSAEAQMQDIPIKGNRSQTVGTGAQGVLGTLHVYDNSNWNNMYIEFEPKAYALIWGEDGQTWTPVILAPSGCEHEWVSQTVTLTSTQISSFKYYVGLLKSDNGVYFWYKSKTENFGDMGIYNKTTDSWTAGNVSGNLSAGATGYFRMWEDATIYDNWRCHFVVEYALKYNANSGTGAPATVYIPTEGDDSHRTIKLSTTEPTRNGYSFEGWATSSARADAGTVDYEAGDYITIDEDIELFAVWSCIVPDAPTAAKISVTPSCAGTGATFSANTAGIPSYVTWYWQTAANGTSTTYPASSSYTTATSAGTYTMYLRAKNTVCGEWSDSGDSPSKSVKVKTPVTASWSTAPANGTADGNMNASLTTNYGSGVVYTSSNPSVATVSGNGTKTCAISYVAAGTARITATVTGGGDDYCSTASCYTDITVVEPSYGVTYNGDGCTKKTGGTTATRYTDFTATFQANTHYTLPSTITVTIGGDEVTKDTEYTWSISAGVGTVSIDGDYISGAVVITVDGVADQFDVTLSYDDDEVSKKTGSTGTDAATYGTDYVATFQAKSGYALQSDVTVTIGESTATKGTEYTWSVSDGVGTLTITGSYITDDITVTVDADADVTTYNVTYAAGVTLTSGSVPTDDTDYDADDEVTVLGNTGSMVYTGYTFRGWTDGTTFFLAGQTFSMPASNVTLTAVWDDGGSACYEWTGTPRYWTTSKKFTIDSKLVIESDGSDTTKTAINTNSKVWGDSHTETVIAISANDKYIQCYFNDASEINTITISAANNNSTSGTDKNYLVLFCANSSFTTGVTGQLHAAPSYKDSQNDSKLVHEFTAPSGTKYVRIYRKISSDVGDYSTSSGAGDGTTTRIYRIEVCTGGSASYDVSFANMTGFSGSTTLPDDIEGVPSGKKIVQPSDPTASGYTFAGWYSDAACTAGNEINWSTMTITADKTIYAKWCATHTVTWMVNGSEYTTGSPTTSANECDGITTLPTAPADNTLSCADSFRGWSTTNLYGESGQAAPASLFVTAADAPSITKDTVFYAIFGDAAPASATSFTTTFTSKAWADTDSKWNSGKDGSNLTSGRGIQVSTTTTGANATTKAEYKAVTSVVVTYSTNASSGAGSIEIKVGGTAVSGDKDVTKEGGTDDRTITYTPATSLDGKVKITVNTTDGSIFIKSVEISHSGTFENYRCICPTMTVTPQLVTASTPIFITSAASKTVRSQDSLLIVGSGLSKSTALTLSTTNGSFALKSRTNGVISTDATGSIDTVAYIYYTPGAGDTSDRLDKNANFTVSVDGNGAKDVTVSQALIGRHVPANFVIAAKGLDEKWYLLPANMDNSNPAPVEINVRNDSVLIPEDHVYTLYQQTTTVINGGNGQYIKLAMHGISPTGGSGHAPLFGSATGTSKLGRSGNAIITNDQDVNRWWGFTQTNTSVSDVTDVKYLLYCAANNKPVTLYNEATQWGLYASGAKNVQEIRLFNWIPNHKVFFADGNLTPASHTAWPETVDSVLVGAKISAPTTPTASGYTFVGWYKDAACTSAWNFASDIITKDTTLYAKWTGSEYNITYHLNGASWVSAGAATYTSGVGYTLPVAGDMSNPGYTFGGWYDNSGLTGSAVTEITTSDYGNKTFWAKWTENTYTITYNANGGSGSTAATEGHYVTVADNGFTAPSGKTFIEWNTLSTGLGSSYNEGDEIELTANMTLYAIWGKSVGTINWNVTKIDSKLYRGGGNYTITAEIDDASWDASDADSSKLVLTASEGVVLRNIAKSINASGKAQITAKFDITTDVNANATKITFTLNVPENNGYAPLADDHNENLDNCTGGKVEVRFTSSEKNDEGDYFGDLSSGGTQMVGNGLAKMIATGDLKISTDTKKNGYRSNRSAIVFKLTATTALDVYYNAGSTSRSFALYSFSSAKSLAEIGTSDYSSKTIVTSVTAIGAAFGNTPVGGTNVSSGVVSLSGSSGGLKATYSSLSAGYYVLTYYSGEGYFYGFDADAGGGGGGAVSPTLTWTPALEDDADWVTDHLAKETGDADFTFTATQNKNSLGAITYASSNTSVATVNATTGKVHIVGAGNATITATMAESGCYNEATADYDITVVDNCDDVAGTVTKEFIDCSTGYRLTVSGHTTTASTSYKWYKDGASLSPAGQAATYETKAAGEYYVIVDNSAAEGEHCPMASTNTVTVESMDVPTATKLLDSVFVKNGRRTPDIALVQTEGADNFQVKSGETEIWNTQTSVTTGFAGCSFYLGTNGIIYLMGQQPDGTEPSGLTAGKETLTFIASSCGGSASGVNIEIHKQAATTYKEIAFVVDGTKNGAWDAVTSGHADGTMLYEYLDSVTVYNESTGERDRLFKLYERNIYKTTDEKTLREHYSQFDAILITDDPNTRTVPEGVKGDDAYKTKGYVNAMGALIDVRPILTMEAFVSALANWKAKGIDGNPTSPNPRQYAMRLDCKNHAIFVGIDPESSNVEVEDIDGVEYWTVAMVDSTKSPYSGWAYNSKTDSLPALQGFSASDVSSLMLLGEISGGTLYAGVERQEEAAARLLLLGLNNKALPNALTPEGKKIIENTLKYLIETDMEKVDDCSNYFIGTTSTDWNTASNWSKGIVPNSPYVKARILKPCVLSGVTTKVSRVDIATSGKSMHLPSGECSGSLTINPTGALIVGGAVRSAIAPYFNAGDLMPTEEEDLVLNTNSSNQAALIFNNDKGDTKATVNLYSLGRKVSDAYQFQYMAIPMEHVAVNPAFAGSGIYTYVWQENGGWERRGYYTDLYAFEGVGITTKFAAARDYQMKGTLASTKSKDIALTKEDAGENIIGNSWTAPLNIASMTTGMRDDDNIEKTVYIYITGNDKADGEDGAQDGTTITPGQWLAIPVDASGWPAWDGLKYIPSMQAYYIKVTGETTLSLDYKTMVRDSNKDSLNVQLRAPQRKNGEEAAITLTKLRVEDSKTHTDLYLFEGDQFSEAYDNGWEAKYMEGDGRSAQLYAMSDTTKMAVLATSDIEGTVLGFAPGKEMTYTFTFFGAGNGYYLNDLKLRTATLISEENSYEFTYEEGDTNRFYISRTPINTPAINTGTDDTRDRVKARKILYNNKLYILLNGRVYSAEGAIVK